MMTCELAVARTEFDPRAAYLSGCGWVHLLSPQPKRKEPK